MIRRALASLLFLSSLACAACSACAKQPPQPEASAPTKRAPAELDGADPSPSLTDGAVDAALEAMAAEIDAGPEGDDPMALHKETKEELLSFFDIRPMTDRERANIRPEVFLANTVGPTYTRMSQGNKKIAKHNIGKRTCLEGLRNVVFQTDEQKATCKGMANMVPVYKNGDPTTAKFCIDVFEFPNRPCELPIVWTAPTIAGTVCALEGKRLCAQEEWNLACRADPAGGPDRRYAYGDDMDLDICNTNKPRPDPPPPTMDCRQVSTTWDTCATETEPNGAFPKCKSRFGVYDQHGNVAEIMTRMDPTDKKVYTQLKGSAWFYTDVSRQPGEGQKPGGKPTYPDQCNFDPRWHVEPIESGFHVNYHLGFRCCLGI